MRLAISNIAWPAEREQEIADWLPRLGVQGVEIAPTKVWPHPLNATDADVLACRRFWERRGLPIVAMQALLFERPDLNMFADEGQRAEMLSYLSGMICLAGRLGAKVLVFGSPKNRRRGNLSLAEAAAVAIPFFRTLGRLALENGTAFCIEPNPSHYSCDFIARAQEGIDLTREVNQPGFGLHLDAAGMFLSEDSPAAVFAAGPPYWQHFHISEPFLAPIGKGAMDHRPLAQALRQVGYNNWLSIEMKTPSQGFDPAHVERAVAFARAEYAMPPADR
jgi:D-psicose/D-tagatose/L-ribulose 3-epimerase